MLVVSFCILQYLTTIIKRQFYFIMVCVVTLFYIITKGFGYDAHLFNKLRNFEVQLFMIRNHTRLSVPFTAFQISQIKENYNLPHVLYTYCITLLLT